MSTVAKILIAVNLALAAVFLGSVSTYLGNQDHWKQKHGKDTESLRADVGTQSKAKVQAEKERDQAVMAQGEAEGARDVAMAESSKLSGENLQLRSNYDSKTAQLTRATAALERLTATVDGNLAHIRTQQKENQALTDALATVQAARNAAVEQVARLDMQLQNETEKGNSLESRVSALNTSLERAQFEINVWHKRYPGDEIMGAEQPSHTGMVLAAKDGANVVVISLGAEDGVKEGFQYVVSRGDKYVATIKIRNVQAKQSAGFSMRDVQKSAPQKGDRVASK